MTITDLEYDNIAVKNYLYLIDSMKLFPVFFCFFLYIMII